MTRRRRLDPLGVSDRPNVVTDPDRVTAIVAETRRKFAYLEQHYWFEKQFGLEPRAFNASLARLRKQVQRCPSERARKTRLHPLLELRINQRAKKLAGLGVAENLGEAHAEYVEEAARWAAANVTAVRGTPGHMALRRYVEGLMALMQDATGLPVIAMRDKDSVYDPQLPGASGKAIRFLVDRFEPGVSDSKLSYWVRQARKKYSGKPMRFCDLFPGYGMTIGSDGMPAGSLTHRIERFEFSAPIYCP